MKRYLRDFAMATAGGLAALVLVGGGIALATASFFYDGVHVPDDKFYQFGGANDAATPDMNMGWDSANGWLQIDDGTNDFARLVDDGTTGTFMLIDTLDIGVDDTTAGSLHIKGAATSTGGEMHVHNAADQDTATDLYNFRSFTDGSLQIRAEGGTNGNLNLFTFNPSTKTAEMTSNGTNAQLLQFRQSDSAAPAGSHVVTIDNDDANEAFIDFVGTSGGNTTSTISTLTTPGSLAGWLQVEVNGTKRWVPFYQDPS